MGGYAVQFTVQLLSDTARRIAGGTVPSAAEGAIINTPSNNAEMGGAEAPVDFQFTLRLRSAQTVRQALVRLKQLDTNYDRMSPQDRAAFDKKYKGLLECPACGLMENVAFSGLLFTCHADALDDDTGLRFEELSQGRFRCPACSATVSEPND